MVYLGERANREGLSEDEDLKDDELKVQQSR